MEKITEEKKVEHDNKNKEVKIIMKYNEKEGHTAILAGCPRTPAEEYMMMLWSVGA